MKALALTTAAAFPLIVPFAYAETSPTEYKEQVEPICKANTEHNKKTLKGVEAEVKKGKLRRPARQIAKAAKALKSTLALLQKVPQPEADKATLSKWLGEIKTEVSLFEAVGKKLKEGNKNAAEKMKIKLDHNSHSPTTPSSVSNSTPARATPRSSAEMIAQIGAYEKHSSKEESFTAEHLAADAYEATLPETIGQYGYRGCVYALARQFEQELAPR
jgi:hypothetical protein